MSSSLDLDLEDLDLDLLAKETSSALTSDACDAAGLRGQTLDPGLSWLAGARGVVIGWARPAVSLPVSTIPEQPYEKEIAFVDSLRVGDVVVLDASRAQVAVWGELLSTAAVARGARGALIDGLTRDRAKIDALGRFAVYGRGARPTDSLGRMALTAYDLPVAIFGVTVFPGDLVVADADGAIIVPQAQAATIIAQARAKGSTEDHARAVISAGGLLRDIWEKYRVL